MSSPLFAAGPAQNELLIHFTGRPPGLKPTEYVTAHIRGLTPEQRLDAILWEQRILGFVPFGAAPPHAMVSLSRVHSTIWPGSSTSAAGLRGASPVVAAHLQCRWRTSLVRQAAAVRRDDARAASVDVRFDSTRGRRSDWVHERSGGFRYRLTTLPSRSARTSGATLIRPWTTSCRAQRPRWRRRRSSAVPPPRWPPGPERTCGGSGRSCLRRRCRASRRTSPRLPRPPPPAEASGRGPVGCQTSCLGR